VSEYKLDGLIEISTEPESEIGDGTSSRVYCGYYNGEAVAVKQLKSYHPRLSSSLIKSYEGLFSLSHENVAVILGLCVQAGQIIIEMCEKRIGEFVMHSLADLLNHMGDELPTELRVTALIDVVSGLSYLHENNVIHGDLKPNNVLVHGKTEGEFLFKLTDYVQCTSLYSSSRSSASLSFKQLMTPGYTAPELFSDDGLPPNPTKSSDIYSFGILSYEVYCCKPAWVHVTMQLISNVKRGYRPVIPECTPLPIAKIIQDCWQSNFALRPKACIVTKALEMCSGCNHESTSQHNSASIPVSSYTQVEEEIFLQIGSDPVVSESANESTSSQSSATVNNAHQSPTACSQPIQSTANLAVHIDAYVYQPSNEGEDVHSQRGSSPEAVDIERIKSRLQIRELKEFQLNCIRAVSQGSDVIVVQPTGSGKSLCFVVPGLMFPGKVALVIEPAVAIITNQVDLLQRKGIDAIILGPPAGSSRKSANFRRMFKSTDLPAIAFCTPEYLFGTESCGNYGGSAAQFSTLLKKKDILSMVAIDEAHKIFDRPPSYRPAFDSMDQLRKLQCPIVAMSATLSSDDIQKLQSKFLNSERCMVLANRDNKQNVKLTIQRYKRCKRHVFTESDEDDEDDENVIPSTSSLSASMWGVAVGKVEKLLEGHCTVCYLDFVKDVDEVTDILQNDGIKVGKYVGDMKIDEKKNVDRKLYQGSISRHSCYRSL